MDHDNRENWVSRVAIGMAPLQSMLVAAPTSKTKALYH